jgi:hypothetical protein
MNKLLVVAAFAIVPLAGCATADGSGTSARAQPMAAGSYYCWKDRLNTVGDALACNWQSSVGEACRATAFSTTLSKGSVAAGPEDAGRCANGQWLVQVTTK